MSQLMTNILSSHLRVSRSYGVLNVPSVNPIYVCTCPFDFALAHYTMHVVRHLFFKGHSKFFPAIAELISVGAFLFFLRQYCLVGWKFVGKVCSSSNFYIVLFIVMWCDDLMNLLMKIRGPCQGPELHPYHIDNDIWELGLRNSFSILFN